MIYFTQFSIFSEEATAKLFIAGRSRLDVHAVHHIATKYKETKCPKYFKYVTCITYLGILWTIETDLLKFRTYLLYFNLF